MQRKVTAAREIIMNSFHRPCKDCGIFHNRWGRSTGHTHGAIYDVPGYLNFEAERRGAIVTSIDLSVHSEERDCNDAARWGFVPRQGRR